MIVFYTSASTRSPALYNSDGQDKRKAAGPERNTPRPSFVGLKVIHLLRRYTRPGGMDAERSDQALEDCSDLNLNRYLHDVFLPRVWSLQYNMTV